jgi:hypothetical protein
LVGLAATLVVVSFMPGTKLDTLESGILLIAQDGATVGWIALVSRRKGRGMGSDFGVAHSPASGWWSLPRFFALGVALQIVVALPLNALQDVYGHHATQGVVNDLRRGSGVGLLVFVIGAGLVAPFAEELLFRGVLLRSLLRRFSPSVAVSISALVFAAVHPLTDPSVGSLIAFPALLLVGLVCGYWAVKSGDLWRSVAIHVGFNALTVVSVLAIVR